MFFGFEHFFRDLGTNLTGIMRHVETGDATDGRFAVDDVLEEGFLAYAAAGDDSEASDYYALFGGGEGSGCACGCRGGAEGEGGDAGGGAEEEAERG